MLNSILGNQLKNEILLTIDKISITSLLPSLFTEVRHSEAVKLPASHPHDLRWSHTRQVTDTYVWLFPHVTYITGSCNWGFSPVIKEMSWVLITHSWVVMCQGQSYSPQWKSALSMPRLSKTAHTFALLPLGKSGKWWHWAVACIKCSEGWVWFASHVLTAEQHPGWQMTKRSSEGVPIPLGKHP